MGLRGSSFVNREIASHGPSFFQVSKRGRHVVATCRRRGGDADEREGERERGLAKAVHGLFHRVLLSTSWPNMCDFAIRSDHMIREHMTRELQNITRIRVRAPLFGPLIALSTCRCPGATGAVARLVYVLCMQLFPYHSALGALIRKNPKPRLLIGSYSRPSAFRKTRRSGEGKLHIICTPFFFPPRS